MCDGLVELVEYSIMGSMVLNEDGKMIPGIQFQYLILVEGDGSVPYYPKTYYFIEEKAGNERGMISSIAKIRDWESDNICSRRQSRQRYS